MTDDPVATCQTCDAPVERVFHPVAVHFKGSGFYNTDYGTRKRSREAKESKDSTGSDSKPDSKSESKSSETKSDTKAAASSSSSD
jgi:predicted nucleic acid-binding Zn ribbon protein